MSSEHVTYNIYRGADSHFTKTNGFRDESVAVVTDQIIKQIEEESGFKRPALNKQLSIVATVITILCVIIGGVMFFIHDVTRIVGSVTICCSLIIGICFCVIMLNSGRSYQNKRKAKMDKYLSEHKNQFEQTVGRGLIMTWNLAVNSATTRRRVRTKNGYRTRTSTTYWLEGSIRFAGSSYVQPAMMAKPGQFSNPGMQMGIPNGQYQQQQQFPGQYQQQQQQFPVQQQQQQFYNNNMQPNYNQNMGQFYQNQQATPMNAVQPQQYPNQAYGGAQPYQPQSMFSQISNCQ